jgi:hypothetical protein
MIRQSVRIAIKTLKGDLSCVKNQFKAAELCSHFIHLPTHSAFFYFIT